MPKINLDELDDEPALTQIRKYHRNKYKNAINSVGYDPYINTMTIRKKFIVSIEKSERLLTILRNTGTKLSYYIELGWTGNQIIISTRKSRI